jgi:hypothetical protein
VKGKTFVSLKGQIRQYLNLCEGTVRQHVLSGDGGTNHYVPSQFFCHPIQSFPKAFVVRRFEEYPEADKDHMYTVRPPLSCPL